MTYDEFNPLKIEYVHNLFDIIREDNSKVYTEKLKRLFEIDKIFAENNLRTVITVSLEERKNVVKKTV